MRCLKRYVAREIYHVITDPPTDIPTGTQIKQRRTENGVTLTTLAAGLGTTPKRLAQLERAHAHSNDLAYRAIDWLNQNTG